ncbi:type II toxin-antitoxin system VapC family toxin [Candidatus Woesearchaeota archaeon]|nr:type II toxin-antitoxin system VapC family toxin [Candidatus Woesearchaeota archaeon]
MAKLLDTTALIDILEGEASAEKLLDELDEETTYTSHICVFELLVGVYALPRENERRLEQATRLLSRLHILELSDAAVRKAAQLQGSLYRKGAPINDTDCLIAATGIVNGVTIIVTRNAKHFALIPGITVEKY